MEWYQVLTIIVSVGGLFLWTNSKIDRLSENVMKEMKDFHGKLERQNAEFHGWVRLMDEKTKNINHKN